MKDEQNIKFVADHYRHGSFNATKAWNHLGITGSSRWKRLRVAASIAIALAFSAVAAFVYHELTIPDREQSEITPAELVSPAYIVKVIDFEDASLPMVIERIKEVYGVSITNVPDDAGQYKLSLHYEGNAIDLIETINNILDTHMKVAEP